MAKGLLSMAIAALAPHAPKIFTTIKKHFSMKPSVTKIPITIHKVRDNTKFTQAMYDHAISEYVKMNRLNYKSLKPNRKTHADLTTELNVAFGTNKSITSMRKLFTGKIDRNFLAPGVQTTFSSNEST